MKQSNIGMNSGFMFIWENGEPASLQKWVEELERRQMPALIKITEPFIDEHADMVKSIADKGFEIAGGNNEKLLWDESYDFQVNIIKRIKDKIESCTNNPMKTFGAMRLSHNENTVKVCNELGIRNVIALGTSGESCKIYKPLEYNVNIISVSSVKLESGKVASLCDHASLAQGATPQGFKTILQNLNEELMSIVAWTDTSGVDDAWFSVYQEFFETCNLAWKKIDEIQPHLECPYAEIPVNRGGS